MSRLWLLAIRTKSDVSRANWKLCFGYGSDFYLSLLTKNVTTLNSKAGFRMPFHLMQCQRLLDWTFSDICICNQPSIVLPEYMQEQSPTCSLLFGDGLISPWQGRKTCRLVSPRRKWDLFFLSLVVIQMEQPTRYWFIIGEELEGNMQEADHSCATVAVVMYHHDKAGSWGRWGNRVIKCEMSLPQPIGSRGMALKQAQFYHEIILFGLRSATSGQLFADSAVGLYKAKDWSKGSTQKLWLSDVH